MNKELTQQLITKYPKLFSKVNTIYCDDGWYNLIDIACSLMQGYADRNQEDPSAQVAFQQIKEKFGGLRIYYAGEAAHEYLSGIRTFAEKLSLTVCEVTGNKGTLHRKAGLVKTVSPETAVTMRMTPLLRLDVTSDVMAVVAPEVDTDIKLG